MLAIKQNPPIQSLPSEILLEIFTTLDTDTKLACIRVSTLWRDTILQSPKRMKKDIMDAAFPAWSKQYEARRVEEAKRESLRKKFILADSLAIVVGAVGLYNGRYPLISAVIVNAGMSGLKEASKTAVAFDVVKHYEKIFRASVSSLVTGGLEKLSAISYVFRYKTSAVVADRVIARLAGEALGQSIEKEKPRLKKKKLAVIAASSFAGSLVAAHLDKVLKKAESALDAFWRGGAIGSLSSGASTMMEILFSSSKKKAQAPLQQIAHSMVLGGALGGISEARKYQRTATWLVKRIANMPEALKQQHAAIQALLQANLTRVEEQFKAQIENLLQLGYKSPLSPDIQEILTSLASGQSVEFFKEGQLTEILFDSNAKKCNEQIEAKQQLFTDAWHKYLSYWQYVEDKFGEYFDYNPHFKADDLSIPRTKEAMLQHLCQGGSITFYRNWRDTLDVTCKPAQASHQEWIEFYLKEGYAIVDANLDANLNDFGHNVEALLEHLKQGGKLLVFMQVNTFKAEKPSSVNVWDLADWGRFFQQGTLYLTSSLVSSYNSLVRQIYKNE